MTAGQWLQQEISRAMQSKTYRVGDVFLQNVSQNRPQETSRHLPQPEKKTLGVKPIALVQVMSFPCGKCVFHIPGMVHACSHQRALPVSQQVLHGG